MLWLDSSARILSSAWESPWSQLIRTHGILMFSTGGHSIYATTHPRMYRYLTSNIAKLQQTVMRDAGDVLFYRTHHIYNHVIRWWVLCVLHNNCIAPTLQRVCIWMTEDSFNRIGHCHHFDQSAINILLANLYAFNAKSYYYEGESMIKIERGKSKGDKELDKMLNEATLSGCLDY